MKAFQNTEISKAQLIAQLTAHAEADEIVKGRYWDGGKGCAVGCCIHSEDHMLFEPMFGIPWRVAWLMDDLFECLPDGEAKQFPLDCIDAIAEGADLSHVYDQWCAWMLVDPVDGLITTSDIACLKQMGDLFVRAADGDEPTTKQWGDAEGSAGSAWAAWAAGAARAAGSARAARAAGSAGAARAAARAAREAGVAWTIKAAAQFISLLRQQI